MKHIIDVFKSKVQEQPDEVAIITTEGISYTYEEVDILTNNLSSFLKSKGVCKGDIIPLLMKRDEFLVFSILSLFKLGASYVPISSDYPLSRVKEIIASFENSPILTNMQYSEYKKHIKNQIYDIRKGTIKPGNFEDSYELDDIAYILYTSGSSGKPKGVINKQRNLSWILNELQNKFTIEKYDKYIFSTPFIFDVSVSEIFGWIYGGGTLVIPSMNDNELSKKLSELIEVYNVTHLALSPSYLQLLLNINTRIEFQRRFGKVKFLMIAGEAFPVKLANEVKELLPNTQIINLYGPTETTVYATMYVIEGSNNIIIPIGKPLDGVKIKIVKKDVDVEDGSEGELLIAGDGVTQGYFNDNNLTSQKYVSIDNVTYYRTGDYVYKTSEGDICFIGRKDFQVQINGIRVELGEIENIIEKESDLKQIKVIYYEKKLICFYIPKNNITKEEIIKAAEGNMPKYMVPKIFIPISEMPLTINRKVDSNELINIFKNTISNPNKIKTHKEINKIKLQVREIVERAINIVGFSDDDNLFSLGIDSLTSIEMIVKLEEKFNLELSEDFIYLNQDISSISNYISTGSTINQSAEENQYLTITTVDKEVIGEYMDKLNTHITGEKIIREYDTHYLQKVYHYDNFESFININIDIPREYELDDIMLCLTKLINRHELLRSVLRDEPKLHFVEYDKVENIGNIALVINNDSENQVNSFIEELLTERKKINVLYMFYIILLKESTKVCIMASHKIMDQKSVHILKKDFYDLLMNKSLDDPMEFYKYVDFAKTTNDDYDFLSDDYVTKLLGIDKHSYQNYNDDEIICKSFDVKEFREENKTVMWIINKVLKEICKCSHIDSLIANTILNFRKFGELDFSRSIGDYHTAIVFPYSSVMSDDDMERELNIICKKYESGYQPQQYIFKNYPMMDDWQKKLEYAFDLNVFVSINYLGEIREADFSGLVEGLYVSRNKLKAFPGKKIYITCFTSKGVCYAYFLTAPKEIKEEMI